MSAFWVYNCLLRSVCALERGQIVTAEMYLAQASSGFAAPPAQDGQAN